MFSFTLRKQISLLINFLTVRVKTLMQEYIAVNKEKIFFCSKFEFRYFENNTC